MLHEFNTVLFLTFNTALLSLSRCIVQSTPHCSQNSLNKENIICKNVQYIKDLRGVGQNYWRQLNIVNDEVNQLQWNDNVDELLNLEHLDLSHAGELILAKNGFINLPNLRNFNVSNCKIEFIKSKFLSEVNRLEILDASWNLLENFDFTSHNVLQSLEVANLSHNYIQSLNSKGVFPKLKVLHLDFNELKVLSLHDYTSLNTLTVSHNLIEKLTTSSFENLPAMENLVITSSPLNQIEDFTFKTMTELKCLNLSANRLEQLSPDVFAALSNLMELDLNSNNLEELAHLQFQHLFRLQNLDISRNSLKSLNSSHFTSLTNLRKLFIYENDIEEIKSDTFANLNSLDTLDISNNDIEHIDANIFGINILPRLRKLVLKGNNLKYLNPLAFTSLPFLQYLSLGFNQLTTLDVRMFAPLRRLEKLHLGNNRIETISADVLESLTNLKELLLDNNRLSFLSNSNATFESLEKVTLEGNPWQCPCWDEMNDWLEKRHISYVRSQSPYFRGQKPLCVVTPVDFCVKNLRLVKEHKIEEIYNSG